MTTSRSRMHVVALEQTKLTSKSLAQLSDARIDGASDQSPSALLREQLRFPVEDAVVIQKCNAVVIVAVVAVDADTSFIQDHLVDAWLQLAPNLGPHLSRLSFHHGLQAVTYLGELAIGLRSVVVGDSQVFSQVVEGLKQAQGPANGPLPLQILARRLGELLQNVTTATALQQGKVSLERIACELLVEKLGAGEASVAVVGLGSAGKLVADILTKETRHRLVLTNRTPRESIRSRFPASRVYEWNDLSYIQDVDAAVLCLTDNVDTRRYAGNLLARLSERIKDVSIVVDLSSPSVVPPLVAPDAVPVARIDDLSSIAQKALTARTRAVNKARQMVRDWAPEVDREFVECVSRPLASKRSEAPPGMHEFLVRSRGEMLWAIRERLAHDDFLEVQGLPDQFVFGHGFGPAGAPHLQTAIARGSERVYQIGLRQTGAERGPAYLEEPLTLSLEIQDVEDPVVLAGTAIALVRVVAAGVDQLQAPTLPQDDEVPVLTYDNALERLEADGHVAVFGAELGAVQEHYLAELVLAEFGSDLFVVVGHPALGGRRSAARNSATGRAQTFDVVLRGWRVATGAVHELDPTHLRRRAQLSRRPDQMERYLAMLAEAPPHGGLMLDLDRLLARALGLRTTRDVVPELL